MRENIEVCLVKDGQKIDCVKKIHTPQSQQVLPALEELLVRHKLATKDIAAIEVDMTPGSFTGIRLGSTIANTLGIFLDIPINGLSKGTLLNPTYSPSTFDPSLS